MGGASPATQNTNQASQSDPWKPTQGALQSLLSQVGGMSPNITSAEDYALRSMAGRAAGGNQFAPAIGNVATELLGGGPDRTGIINDAYAQYRTAMAPTVAGNYLDPNKNPFFGGTTSAITDDAISRVNAMYAGAGRDPTGAGSMPGSVGREVTKAVAPIYADVYNTERGRQLGAAESLYGAGNTTGGLLSNLDQVRFGNMQAGIGAADAANTAANYGDQQMLALEAMRWGLPISRLSQMSGIVTPIAGLGGASNSTSTTTSTPASNPWQTAAGLGIAGLGLMSGNPMMAMGGLSGGLGGSGMFGNMFGTQPNYGGSPATNPWLNPATYGNIRSNYG